MWRHPFVVSMGGITTAVGASNLTERMFSSYLFARDGITIVNCYVDACTQLRTSRFSMSRHVIEILQIYANLHAPFVRKCSLSLSF